MRIDILTTFTEMFPPVLGASILGRAAQKGILDFNLCDIRQYSENKHHNTDDYPFGGGAGMVMLAQPIYSCLDAVDPEHKARRILLSPRGERFRQRWRGNWLRRSICFSSAGITRA